MQEALELNKQALQIHHHEKLARRIAKMEVRRSKRTKWDNLSKREWIGRTRSNVLRDTCIILKSVCYSASFLFRGWGGDWKYVHCCVIFLAPLDSFCISFTYSDLILCMFFTFYDRPFGSLCFEFTSICWRVFNIDHYADS